MELYFEFQIFQNKMGYKEAIVEVELRAHFTHGKNLT